MIPKSGNRFSDKIMPKIRGLSMQDEPTLVELTKAVADFLRSDIAPMISGHDAFKLRVAINILDLVTRQLNLEQASDAAEATRLAQLLRIRGPLFELNSVLAEKIARGDVDLQTPGLAEHLWQTTMEKVAVDQPTYASYKRELARDAS
jgi:uncharacterized protein DUF6285